jgi:HEAT repeat protein
LRDGDETTRLHVVHLFGVIKQPESVGPLILALKDPSPDIRAAVAEALGRLKAPQAVQPLIEALGDRERHVRSAAAEALASITGEDLGEDQALWVKWWEGQKGEGAGKD